MTFEGDYQCLASGDLRQLFRRWDLSVKNWQAGTLQGSVKRQG